MKQQRADAVVKSAEDPLGTAVLLGCVWACEMKGSAVRCEKVTRGSIVKLFSVVSLKGENRAPELGGDVGVKSRESGKNIGLATKWKRPRKVREIIK